MTNLQHLKVGVVLFVYLAVEVCCQREERLTGWERHDSLKARTFASTDSSYWKTKYTPAVMSARIPRLTGLKHPLSVTVKGFGLECIDASETSSTVVECASLSVRVIEGGP